MEVYAWHVDALQQLLMRYAVVPAQVVEMLTVVQVVVCRVVEGQNCGAWHEEYFYLLAGVLVAVALRIVGYLRHGVGHVQPSPQAAAQIEGLPALRLIGCVVFMYRPVCVKIGKALLPSLAIGGEHRRVLQQHTRDVLSAVCRGGDSVTGTTYQDSYLYLIKYNCTEAGLHKFEAILNDVAGRYNLYGAISDVFFCSSCISAHCAQAMEALSVAAMDKPIVRFTDIYQDVICMRMLELFPVESCIQPETMKLLSLDPVYCETAKMYASSGGRLSATAGKLKVHKNTVLNRIEKINELCQLDLTDRAAAFSFLQQLMLIETAKRVGGKSI